jgi:hypothetical protein
LNRRKFPVFQNGFPDFTPTIPYSVIQGIAAYIPKASAALRIIGTVDAVDGAHSAASK